MSLMIGRGPFGAHGGTWSFGPQDHVWYLEAWQRRLRGVLAGQTIVDTERAAVLHETDAFPVHFVPRADVSPDALVSVGRIGHDDRKGAVFGFDIRVGDHHAGAAAVAYPEPPPEGPPLADLVAVRFGALERWFDEDDPVYGHLRDTFHRVDVRSSARHVVVRYRDTVIAESSRPKLLFETGNPTRYYLPLVNVRTELLTKSKTVSECPYKGDGQHWHLSVDDGRVEDAAWSLPHPLPEGLAAAEHLCFYPAKVELVVDGERIEEMPLW